MISIKFDYSKFKKYLEKIEIILPQAMDQGLQEIAKKAAKEARAQTSGQLAKATQAYRNTAESQGVLANKFYARWVEYGNGPAGSRIYPTKSSCLHFYMPDGTEVFAKSVKASEPKPFMASAVSFINDNKISILRKHINKALKSFQLLDEGS